MEKALFSIRVTYVNAGFGGIDQDGTYDKSDDTHMSGRFISLLIGVMVHHPNLC